ncbi:MAG: hypothetical protein L6R48_02705 [Planctomycetes bacterium]|nr:hypothetical protein [Planctomycetota bacterium]
MTTPDPVPAAPPSDQFVEVLGVLYLHQRTADGGDLYLTRFGMAYADLLRVENWYEPEWFQSRRQRLLGTSAVFRVPTREVAGRSIDLVVKNCRVGEDIPVDTQLLREFVNAEFNSPWEEFSLVMEMREGRHGPPALKIEAQEPLAIYVPPERMQEWQTGRSEDRINRIRRQHPGLDLDILKQYKLIYGWIHGLNVVETLVERGAPADMVRELPWRLNDRVLADLAAKGFTVADMKPVHIILPERVLAEVPAEPIAAAAAVADMVEQRRYAMIDYELLLRTPEYQSQVHLHRRICYFDELHHRFDASPLPPHLAQVEVLGVPFVHGQVESTGGRLWVVGRNARLFDFFLPERWRRTPGSRLSPRHDVHYTLTKDQIHLVWKTSMVGERPVGPGDAALAERAHARGYNSPFEEAALAAALAAAGIPTTFVRAIYRTGSRKLEPVEDHRRYDSHRAIIGPDGRPVLADNHNYVVIQGYFNGSLSPAAPGGSPPTRPLDLEAAVARGLMGRGQAEDTVAAIRARMAAAGFDGGLLDLRDFLVSLAGEERLLRGPDGAIEVRVCDFKLIGRLPAGSP